MKEKKTQKLFNKPAQAPKAPAKGQGLKQPPGQAKGPQKKKDETAKAKSAQGAPTERQEGKAPQNQAPGQGKSNKRRRSAYKPGYQKKNQGRSKQQDDMYSNLPSGKNIVTKRPVWESDVIEEGESHMNTAENGTAGRGGRGNGAAQGDNRLDNSISKAIQRTKLPEAPKNDKMLYDFSENELREDTAIKVINRNGSGDIKYSSFEDYLEKTQSDK